MKRFAATSRVTPPASNEELEVRLEFLEGKMKGLDFMVILAFMGLTVLVVLVMILAT